MMHNIYRKKTVSTAICFLQAEEYFEYVNSILGKVIAMIYDNIGQLIGRTPMVRLHLNKPEIKAELLAKVESFNPGGSIKDRVGAHMLLDAEEKGLISPGATIIEPTSGNTGVGLALVCAVKGYKLILTMPENMSIERRLLLKAYGAELILTPKELGMQGAVDKANELKQQNPNSFIPQQFSNPTNPLAHELTTAKEILEDTNGNINIFVASIGTGGTLCGCAKTLKKFNNNIKIYGIEPENSPLITQGKASSHKIQGIGANFIPKNYNNQFVDEVLTVNESVALKTARNLAQKEGILCGISSGANVAKALELAQKEENRGKIIVTIICDTGERYLSNELFNYDR